MNVRLHYTNSDTSERWEQRETSQRTLHLLFLLILKFSTRNKNWFLERMLRCVSNSLRKRWKHEMRNLRVIAKTRLRCGSQRKWRFKLRSIIFLLLFGYRDMKLDIQIRFNVARTVAEWNWISILPDVGTRLCRMKEMFYVFSRSLI